MPTHKKGGGSKAIKSPVKPVSMVKRGGSRPAPLD